jgi:ABC-type dipeptide/oligopeptide/nickel transport system permease subunit
MTVDQPRREERISLTSKQWRMFLRNRVATLCAVLVIAILLIALLAPWIAPHCPIEQRLRDRLQPPSRHYLLGTDQLGRDNLSRIIYGSRISVGIGLISVAIAGVLGTSLGMISGYLGGAADNIIMRVMDVFLAFPGVLLAILIISLLGAGMENVVIALIIWLIPTFSRLARGQVLSQREQYYIEAARASGCSVIRILRCHLLANILSPLIVYATLTIPAAILTTAALSFLGLGVRPPTPEWGVLISTGRILIREAPHLVLFPGMAIFITAMAFNFVGDALRDILDPKTRREVSR